MLTMTTQRMLPLGMVLLIYLLDLIVQLLFIAPS
jgi:hypothetical protein